jgi:hypothetical protein
MQSVKGNGLHGVISQKMELFITTVVRTSNALHCTVLTKLKSIYTSSLCTVQLHFNFFLQCEVNVEYLSVVGKFCGIHIHDSKNFLYVQN